MSWTDGVDQPTGTLILASVWNQYLGALGSLMVVKTHAHGGATGEGSQALGPLTMGDLTDAAAPAAPGAGKTRISSTGGRLQQRAGAAGTTARIYDESDIDRQPIGSRPAAGVVDRLFASSDETPKTLYRDNGASWDAIAFADPTTTRGDLLARTAAGLTRLAIGGANSFLKSDGTDVSWTTTAPPDSRLTLVYKSADEGVTSSTVMQNDDALLFSLAANEKWAFELVLRVDRPSGAAGNNAGFKYQFTVPAGASGFFYDSDATGTAHESTTSITAAITGLYTVLAAFDHVLRIRGVVINGANAGTFQLQWAQANSSTDTVNVMTGSHLVAMKVA